MKRKNIIIKKEALELKIKPSSYKVLNILILYSDKNGRCYPSVRMIEEKYHLSHTTINEALKELETNHIIMKFKRKKGTGKIDSNEYIIAPQYLPESIRKKQELFDYDWLNDTEEGEE